MRISEILDKYYQHFNAREVKDSVNAWVDLFNRGGKMFISLGGAMSTAGIGGVLSKLIENDLVCGISTTGANLEEDYFRAVAYKDYLHFSQPHFLSLEDEEGITNQEYSRVYDTAIPVSVMQRTYDELAPYFEKAIQAQEIYAPYEYYYQMFRDRKLTFKDSWLSAACEKDVFIVTPGYEDSSLGNIVTAQKEMGNLPHYNFMTSGLEQMSSLAQWYQKNRKEKEIGFYQIGGGISGDFPLCVVPLILNDLKISTEPWSLFTQISDSTTSYGSFSGALPKEKITWRKINKETPAFSINSDATIVFPLMVVAILEKLKLLS